MSLPIPKHRQSSSQTSRRYKGTYFTPELFPKWEEGVGILRGLTQSFLGRMKSTKRIWQRRKNEHSASIFALFKGSDIFHINGLIPLNHIHPFLVGQLPVYRHIGCSLSFNGRSKQAPMMIQLEFVLVSLVVCAGEAT